MSNLKCDATCKNCGNEKVCCVSTKHFNDKGRFVDSIQDQWQYMYCCEVCQGFNYPDLKSPFDGKTKKFVYESNKK